MNSQVCPNCHAKLQPFRVSEGVVWTCGSCGGLWANTALLRRHSDRGTAERLWRIMRSSNSASEQKCPGCANAMTQFNVEKVADPSTTVTLTGCSRCQAFWFDGGELEQLRLSFGGQARERLPPQRRSGSGVDAHVWIPYAGYEIGGLLDGLDFDFGD